MNKPSNILGSSIPVPSILLISMCVYFNKTNPKYIVITRKFHCAKSDD